MGARKIRQWAKKNTCSTTSNICLPPIRPTGGCSLMRILVTGAAGFIGFFVSQGLLARGDEVVGLDNLNDYYDPRSRLRGSRYCVSTRIFVSSGWIWSIAAALKPCLPPRNSIA